MNERGRIMKAKSDELVVGCNGVLERRGRRESVGGSGGG